MQQKYLICLCLLLSACVNPRFQAISGKTPEDVRAIMGDPATIAKEQGHEMWTYKQNDCTQIVFFNQRGVAASWHEMGVCQTEE